MPLGRDYGKNVNAHNVNTTSLVPDQEDLNAEFQNATQFLAQITTNQNNHQVPIHENGSSGLVASRVRDFVRMNSLEF